MSNRVMLLSCLDILTQHHGTTPFEFGEAHRIPCQPSGKAQSALDGMGPINPTAAAALHRSRMRKVIVDWQERPGHARPLSQ
jgi:hypothetical protein